MNSNSGVGAYNATVRTAEPDDVAQAAREQRVIDTAATVDHITAKLDRFESDPDADPCWREKQSAALGVAMETARAEAEQARAEAQKGSE